MRRALVVALLLGSSLSFAPGCARNPVSGRPEVVLISARTERELGQQEAAKVEALLGAADDEDLQVYVAQVGARLAQHSPWQEAQYSFRVVDTPEPNAFALPGGPVYVSRGLLALLDSEDELACVIGHEIGHVAARHSVRRLTVAAPFAVVGIPGAILGSVSQVLGTVVAAPARLGGSLALGSYSRSQERQADRIGMDLAGKAGWDPRALAGALATLEREDTLRRGEPRKADFFDTHPTMPDRISGVERYAESVSRAAARPLAENRAAFLATLEGLLLGPNPRGGVFAGSTFLHPELGFAVSFPEGWTTDNQPELVLASDPESGGRAFSVLQLVAQSKDPMAGPKTDQLDPKLVDALEYTRIHGLPAARLQTTRRGTTFDLTWVVHRGRVYRISGVSPAPEFERHRGSLEAVARSFRPLRADDRARIRESRLRLVSAHRGESVAALLERAGSDWELAMARIANALPDDQGPLSGGQILKVAIPQAYAPSHGGTE